MAYGRGKKHVNQHVNWNGYQIADFRFDIDVEVNDAKTKLHCTIRNFKSSFRPGSRKGWGFINVGAFAWSIPSFNKNYHQEFKPDTWEKAWNQCLDASGGKVKTNTIWGAYASDNARQSVKGEIRGPFSWDFNLNPSDFDANGRLIGTFNLVNYWGRYYKESLYPNGAVVQSGNNYMINSNDLDWEFFPFAVIKGGQWMSCDRSGGFVGVRKGDTWRTVRNGTVGGDQAFIKKGNNWRQAPRIGKT